MARLTLRKRERYGLSAKGAYISSSLDAYEIGINRRSTRHGGPLPAGLRGKTTPRQSQYCLDACLACNRPSAYDYVSPARRGWITAHIAGVPIDNLAEIPLGEIA